MLVPEPVKVRTTFSPASLIRMVQSAGMVSVALKVVVSARPSPLGEKQERLTVAFQMLSSRTVAVAVAVLVASRAGRRTVSIPWSVSGAVQTASASAMAGVATSGGRVTADQLA